MGAQYSKFRKRNSQKSSALTKLPVELLYLIISSLDAASILSLRLTCCLALQWVFPSLRKLLKSRKYFLHPYSFKLLEELSMSPAAEYVERIVIGTETFQFKFHLTATEYGRTLASTLQRFTNLRAVEIRDIVPPSSEGYHDDDYRIDGTGWYRMTNYFRRYDNHRRPYEEQYNSRWGEEEDHLHCQGLEHVSREYRMPAFRKPMFLFLPPEDPHPNPSIQLGELFKALLQACTVAKAAGVNVTDFRVTLMYQWGIRDEDLAGFTGQDRSQFLSSLEVLHLAMDSAADTTIPTNIGTFTSACTSLKWIRVVFGCDRWRFREWRNFITLLSQMGERSPLNRLDLGDVDIDGPTLTSLILNSRPKILNLWLATISEPRPDTDDDSEWGWGPMLREVAGVVGHVRLHHAQQSNKRHKKDVRLVQGGGVSTLRDVGHGYIHLSPDSVEAVVRDMVISPRG